jgi:hypothetical protein
MQWAGNTIEKDVARSEMAQLECSGRSGLRKVGWHKGGRRADYLGGVARSACARAALGQRGT